MSSRGLKYSSAVLESVLGENLPLPIVKLYYQEQEFQLKHIQISRSNLRSSLTTTVTNGDEGTAAASCCRIRIISVSTINKLHIWKQAVITKNNNSTTFQ
jgi:hypothetical protein